MKNKIAIVTLNYPLGVLTDVTSMAVSLAEAGFWVDIFIDRYMYENTKIEFAEKSIKVTAIDTGDRRTGGLASKRILGFSIGGVHNFLADRAFNAQNYIFQNYLKRARSSQSFKEKLFSRQKYFFSKERRFSKQLEKYIDKNYACIIAVEPHSLISATIAAEDKKVPVIYHNMELLLSYECKTKLKKILKEMEKECSRRCVFTIIQDKNRAEYLIKDNDLDAGKVKFLPISSKEKIYTKKSDYLYKHLNIPKNKTIVLFAGNLSPVTLPLEIAKAAKKWKDDYVLVLHGWNKLSPRDKYAREIKKIADSKKVWLSEESVDLWQLPELLSSAKIGLLFYKKTGPNSYEIGSSLNKLVQYLRVGMPVISIDFPSLKEKIEKNNCGFCVKSPEFISSALGKIMADYDYYSKNARKLYRKDYDFSKNFKNILKEIKKLAE